LEAAKPLFHVAGTRQEIACIGNEKEKLADTSSWSIGTGLDNSALSHINLLDSQLQASELDSQPEGTLQLDDSQLDDSRSDHAQSHERAIPRSCPLPRLFW